MKVNPFLGEVKHSLISPFKSIKNTLIIDSNNLSFKAISSSFYSTMEYDGLPTGHIFGCFDKIRAILNNHVIKPNKKGVLVITCDENKSKKRLKIHPEYKGTRIKRDDETLDKILQCYKLITYFPHIKVSINNEADDAINSYIVQNKNYNHKVFSSDRDLWALFHKAEFYETASNKFYKKDYINKYSNVKPGLVPLFKGIFGDKTDNIPSIMGEATKKGRIIIKAIENISDYEDLFQEGLLPDAILKILNDNKNQIKIMTRVGKLYNQKIKVTENKGDFSKLMKLLKKYYCKKHMKTLKELELLFDV